MRNFEKRLSSLIIGSIFPVSFGLLSVTLWMLLDKSENRPLIYLAIGILLGLFIDLKYLKGWIRHRFDMPTWSIISIYLLYNVFVYGFFMGFPVFNVFLGLLAGYYFGNRICFHRIRQDRHSKLIKQVSLITGLIMALVCISSGFLALMDYGAAGMIQHVLRLNFEVTGAMIWGIVLIGGSALILINVFLTRFALIKTIQHYTR